MITQPQTFLQYAWVRLLTLHRHLLNPWFSLTHPLLSDFRWKVFVHNHELKKRFSLCGISLQLDETSVLKLNSWSSSTPPFEGLSVTKCCFKSCSYMTAFTVCFSSTSARLSDMYNFDGSSSTDCLWNALHKHSLWLHWIGTYLLSENSFLESWQQDSHRKCWKPGWSLAKTTKVHQSFA